MGDSKESTIASKSSIHDTPRMPILVDVLMLVLAVLAPFAVMSYSSYSYSFIIQSLFWMTRLDSSGFYFETIPLYAVFTMFPFLLIRLTLPYQMFRYYHGRTTRTRTAAVAIISELPFIAVMILQFVFSLILGGMMFVVSLPFPIMMIVGFLLLWRFPVSEVTVPWEGADEPTPWWEEKPQEKTEPPADDQPW
ncbi:MAG: hypothetical protein ACXABX_01100 [Candidatus Thorarchaeota archaeon]|jgi:hypothetical protein